MVRGAGVRHPTQQGEVTVSADDTLVGGTVQRWSDEDGWGVLTADGLDGTVFAHYSMICDQAGWRGLRSGQQVWFTWEQPGQDGCAYRAVEIYTTEERQPVDRQAQTNPGVYSSSLTIEFGPPPPS
jgi:cold shock CspA family protein